MVIKEEKVWTYEILDSLCQYPGYKESGDFQHCQLGSSGSHLIYASLRVFCIGHCLSHQATERKNPLAWQKKIMA